MADDAFIVYDLLFYLCITHVLIVMFFSGLCFCAFICLVLLVDGLPSLLLFIQGVFFNVENRSQQYIPSISSYVPKISF
jgi:hypothetical protein